MRRRNKKRLSHLALRVAQELARLEGAARKRADREFRQQVREEVRAYDRAFDAMLKNLEPVS